VFIVACGALCLWLVGWGFAHRAETQGAVLAGIGAAGVVALAAYLRRFLREAKGRSHANGLHPKLAAAAGFFALVQDAQACVTCVGQLDGDTGRSYAYGIAFLAVLVLGTLSGLSYMVIKTIREREISGGAVPNQH
ncbi:MAG: hypothetical protein HY553_08710, partial [Elusimicrobia bacterium]|nr:hypothetical protein [Elusimicrobiota bacterium]